MALCTNCTHARETGIDRIDCANTAATPRTDSYPGCGAHPVAYDPAIVTACESWEMAAGAAPAESTREALIRLRAARPWASVARPSRKAANPAFVGANNRDRARAMQRLETPETASAAPAPKRPRRTSLTANAAPSPVTGRRPGRPGVLREGGE